MPTTKLPLSDSTKSVSLKLGLAASLLVLVGTVASMAQGQMIVSSLGNSSMDTINFAAGAWAASPFQTDGQAWTVSSVTLRLGAGGALSSTATTLSLYSDVSGKPGVPLADLGSRTITDSQLLLWTFTPISTVTLSPSTIYWIALGNVSSSQGLNVSMLDNLTPSAFTFTGVPGASMSYTACSGIGLGSNPPLSWNGAAPEIALLFEVDGIIVPEPGQTTLMLLGATGFFVRRLRRTAVVSPKA